MLVDKKKHSRSLLDSLYQKVDKICFDLGDRKCSKERYLLDETQRANFIGNSLYQALF